MTGRSSHDEALQKVELEIVKKKSGPKPVIISGVVTPS
jgi:hypothetical protein